MSDKTQQIRERAHQLWQEQGEPDGHESDHWLQAEQELSEGGIDNANEGEGSRTGAGANNEHTADFVRSEKVGEAAVRAVAGIDDPVEAADMKKAEKDKKSRSRGEDPARKK